MTQQQDPWRTLGLAPGASADEVRRAYRRLAKANHPDAAGASAIPRFLAIQAAYEQLVRPGARRRPGTRPGSSPATAPTEPWRADPDRARASGRADGRRPGARPGGSRPSSTAGGAGAGASTSGDADGTRTDRGATGASGASGRARRPSGRRRSPNRATPYSTSYDPADEEPFEPGWSGAGWYGAASGTYWTVNPKEYADPRKHGPAYQRRARRDANGWILDDDGPPDDAGQPDAAAPDRGGSTGRRSGAPRPDSSWTGADPGAGPRAPDWSASPGWESARDEGVGPSFTVPDWRAWFVQPPPGSRFRGPLLRPQRSTVGRLVVAFLGWAGLATVAVTVLDEMTGCGRFSASCDPTGLSSWLLVGPLYLFLLALPRLATWLAHGTIATFVVGVPASILLSASGGARQPDASAAVISVIGIAAWVAGVAYAIVVPRLGARDGTYHAADEPPP
jgi:curved DNA-binding protein CbpA